MTETQNYPIKLEPVEVVLKIKTIHTNIHKIIQDDFNDEDIAASVALNFNFDDANKIKMEPAVDYTLELDEDREYEIYEKGQGELIKIEDQVTTFRSKRVKRRHTVIAEEMLDVINEESLAERIKKRVRRSNTKGSGNQNKKSPETEVPPNKGDSKLQIKQEKTNKKDEVEKKEESLEERIKKRVRRSNTKGSDNQIKKSPESEVSLNKRSSKLQIKQEKTNKKERKSDEVEKKDSRAVKSKKSRSSIDPPKLDQGKLKIDETDSKPSKKLKNQKITNFLQSTEKDGRSSKNVKSEKPEAVKNGTQLTFKNGKIPKIPQKPPKAEQNLPKNSKSSKNSSSSSLKSEALPQRSPKYSKPSQTSAKSSISNVQTKTKQEECNDSAPDNITDSQHSEDTKKFDKSLKPPLDDPSAIASSVYECKKCFKLFANKLKLYYHSKTHLPKVECKICGRKVQAYLMTRHLRYHKDNKPFRCDLCPRTFISIVSIRNHMYQHTTVKKFYCDVCGRGYNDNRHLREHKLGHTNPSAYRCDLCPKGYERKQALEAHMYANHMEDSKWYTCKTCGYKTKMLTVIYSHRKRHDKTIACEDCDKKFANKSELQDHVLAIHVKVKNVKCTICGKFFASKRYMLKHIRRTHADPKKFKCEICENTFKCIDALKQHLRKHNTKTRECEICKRKVKESYMKKHQVLNAECRKKMEQKSKKIKHERSSSSESSNGDESGDS